MRSICALLSTCIVCVASANVATALSASDNPSTPASVQRAEGSSADLHSAGGGASTGARGLACLCGLDARQQDFCFQDRFCADIVACTTNADCGPGERCLAANCCSPPLDFACLPECAGGCTDGGVCTTYEECSAAPFNDACIDAQVIDVPSDTQGTTDAATLDHTPFCDGIPTGPGVWYRVSGTGNRMTATTCNDDSFFDTRISVFCGDCDRPFCIAGNDDDCGLPGAGGFLSTVDWCSEAGVEYLILVHGFENATGRFTLSVFDDGDPCPNPDSCGPPVQACCHRNGECANLTRDDCVKDGGVPQPPGIICELQLCQLTEACCLPEGRCEDLLPIECREVGGRPLGQLTLCEDDANGNNIDDACELDEPCEDCGPGPHWVDQCRSGADIMPSGALVGIDTSGDCQADTSLVLSGPVSVWRSDPRDESAHFPGAGTIDGHLDVLDTRITNMELTGGGVSLRAGAGAGGPLRPSLGAIIERPTNPLIGDSFFDVFVEIELPGGDLVYNQVPLRVRDAIDCLPPLASYIHVDECIELFTSPVPGQGQLVARLVAANHSTFPRCGDPVTGPCNVPNGTPFCDAKGCCETVCEIEPDCCLFAWDETCVSIASDLCVQPVACCLPDGRCENLSRSRCRAVDGAPLGPNSSCRGDGDGNGRDDACELNEPCDECGPGDHWVDDCPGGIDRMPSRALAGLDLNLDCQADVNIIASGEATVRRSVRTPHEIDTEMVAMTLVGGGITIRAGAGGGMGGALSPSLGKIIEQQDNPALANSFFDLFLEVSGGPLPGPVTNLQPVRVQAKIDCLPPNTTYIKVEQCIALRSPTGQIVANLVSANHQTYPTEACCLPHGVCEDLRPRECRRLNGAPLGPESKCLGDRNGNGRDDACEPNEPCDECGPGPHFVDECPAGIDVMPSTAEVGLDLNNDCEPDVTINASGAVTVRRGPGMPHEIDAEIVALAMSGGGVTIRAGAGGGVAGLLRPSPGKIVEQPDDPAVADSFFDVFVEVSSPILPAPLYNVDPLHMRSKIDCLPPEAAYIQINRCVPLYDTPRPGPDDQPVVHLTHSINHTFPEEACCLSEGKCDDLRPAHCRRLDGAPMGPGSRCLGDRNGNGRDDACEPNEPCDECGPGDHWVDTCPGGTDTMPSRVLAGIDLSGDCEADVNIVASGPVTVQRSPGVPHHIDTEIVAMSLSGSGVTLRAGAGGGAGGNLRPSLGAIVEQQDDPALANSFFDVFVEISGPALPSPLYNVTALRVQSKIDCLPPDTTYFKVESCIPLYRTPTPGPDDQPAAWLVSANHETYPTEACCLPDGTCEDLRRERCRARDGAPQGPGSECSDEVCRFNDPCDECGPGAHWVDDCPGGTDTMPSRALAGIDLNGDCQTDINVIASGPVTVQRSPGVPHHIATEIVSMSLSGNGVTLRAGAGGGVGGNLRPSPGAIVEQQDDPALANSFFDIFLEVSGAALPGPLYNATPVRVQSKIDCLPPDTTYIKVVECLPLFRTPTPGPLDQPAAWLVSADHQTYPEVHPRRWESVARHGDVGEVGLEIPDNGRFTEPRQAGLRKIVISYDGPIDPSSAILPAVQLTGCDLNGQPVDLSQTTIGVSTAAGNTKLVVTFDPKLPGSDFNAHVPTKYRLVVDGLKSPGNKPIGPHVRVFSAVLGDAFGAPLGDGLGDFRVNAQDNGLVRSFAASNINPIDPNNPDHVRSDVFTDGRINAQDNGLVRSLAAEGLDGTGLLTLTCP